ncbi:replication factor RFC1 C terminal domain-containing protein [Melanogaster broomeanus]|nr:replication factor RFC1 C terminal domain-containing protein [Melanogaster broomeanus]
MPKVGSQSQPRLKTRSSKAMMIDSHDDEVISSRKSAMAPKRKRKVVSSESATRNEIGVSAKEKGDGGVALPSKASSSEVADSASSQKPTTGKPAPKKKAKARDDDFVVSDSEEESPSTEEDDHEYEDEAQVTKQSRQKAPPAPAKPKPKPKPKAEPKARASPKKPPQTENNKGKATSMDEDMASAPAPAPVAKSFNWAAAKAAKLAGPRAPGSKTVPEPKTPGCLLGLSFAFTRELSSFSRDEATDLAKRYGGRVTGQPPSKTSFVVLGDNAGPSKVAAIKRHGLRSLSEQFFELIGTRQEAIKNAAKELERREKDAKPDLSSQLWTTRCAPQNLKEICGNKVQTTSAHLCAKLEGFTPIELNASDACSKKLVESRININNSSLDGWMGVTITDKSCLIMDEVDGMSADDREGVGALNALIKKTKIPIICIANDAGAQKLKPLKGNTFNFPFRKEKMKNPANVVDQLIGGAQWDIRRVLNTLSTWRLSSSTMATKINEKNTILTPFDVTNKLLGPYMFSHTARETLGDKIEMCFHDHSFENYLKTQPARVRNLEGPPKTLKHLRLMDKATFSISDALIHGSVAMSFPQWLGQNSKQGKLNRQLGEVQIRMRLKVSGNKTEIRQSYVPALFPHIVMWTRARWSVVDDVIERMDEYYLSREDWDTIVELGVDQNKDDVLLKKISTATKTSFTKKYNAGEHPIPFHNTSDLSKVAKKLVGAPALDLEEVFDVGDEVPEVSDSKNTKDDITGTKLIQPTEPLEKGKTSSQLKSKAKK